MQVCRICLALGRKMYPFDSNFLLLYEQITGITEEEDLLPKFVCWECKYYMLKYNGFKSKAIENHCILTEILYKDGVMTESSIKAASLNHHKPTLACTEVYTEVCTEVCNLSTNSEIKIMNVKKEVDSPETEIKIEVEEGIGINPDDDSDNFIAIEAKHEFVNTCDGFITAKEEFIPETTADISHDSSTDDDRGHDTTADEDSERSDDPVSDNLIQSNTRPDCMSKKNKTVKQQPKQDDAKTSKKKGTSSIIYSKKSSYDIDKDIFTITELTMDEQIAEMQKRKESDSYKKSPYKCENCFQGFVDDASFQRHMEKHAESCGPYVCTLCKVRYSASFLLKRHITSHSRKIVCKKCTKFSTYLFYKAYKHQKNHHGEKYECRFCTNTFLHKSTYLDHVRVTHPREVVCTHCGQSFVNNTGLISHVKRLHGAAPIPVPADGPACARCDIRFSCQEALDTHRRVSLKHADERESTSREKGATSRDPMKEAQNHRRNVRRKLNRLNRIKKPDHTSKPFPDGPKPCEQCEQKLPTPRAYAWHFRSAHRGMNRTVFCSKQAPAMKHMCEVCGALFPCPASLDKHKYKHAPSKQFKCGRCGKLFQLEVSLYFHQKRHCGVRVDYPCGVCGKTFATKPNLTRHMVIHKGIEYKCELCDKVFNCPLNRKAHMDYVHHKKPRPKRNRNKGTKKNKGESGGEQQPEMLQDPSDEADMQE